MGWAQIPPTPYFSLLIGWGRREDSQEGIQILPSTKAGTIATIAPMSSCIVAGLSGAASLPATISSNGADASLLHCCRGSWFLLLPQLTSSVAEFRAAPSLLCQARMEGFLLGSVDPWAVWSMLLDPARLPWLHCCWIQYSFSISPSAVSTFSAQSFLGI